MLGLPDVSYTKWLPFMCYTIWICLQNVCQGSDANEMERDKPCVDLGGYCTYTYFGCEHKHLEAKFVRGLCAGPNYRQCCVITVLPTEPVYVEPWRMCYSCEYTLSNGETKGIPGCQDPFSPHASIPQMNCTDYCIKQVIKLDSTSHSVKRTCGSRCHNNASYPNVVSSKCCYGNLCNAAPAPFSLVVRMELYMLILFALIRDSL